jgi:hypothetical protein
MKIETRIETYLISQFAITAIIPLDHNRVNPR